MGAHGDSEVAEVNLNVLRVPDDADDATRWGIWEEFNLRRERYEAHQLFEHEGVVGAYRRFMAAMVGKEPKNV